MPEDAPILPGEAFGQAPGISQMLKRMPDDRPAVRTGNIGERAARGRGNARLSEIGFAAATEKRHSTTLTIPNEKPRLRRRLRIGQSREPINAPAPRACRAPTFRVSRDRPEAGCCFPDSCHAAKAP